MRDRTGEKATAENMMPENSKREEALFFAKTHHSALEKSLVKTT